MVCQHCKQSPPFIATVQKDPKTGLTKSVELVFARHMVEKHPEHAKGKTPEAKEAAEKVEAAKKADADLKVAAKKAVVEKAEADKKAKEAAKVAAKKAKDEATEKK